MNKRLLAYVLDVFDLTFQVVPSPFVMRQFVKTGVFLPERLGILFVGAAEMVGCAMFDELRRVGMELFADEPEVAERVTLLYREILTDEVGHVGYGASRCTAAERPVMRWLYPRIARLFARQTAEIRPLVDRDEPRATRPSLRRRRTHRRPEQRDVSGRAPVTRPSSSSFNRIRRTQPVELRACEFRTRATRESCSAP